MITIRGEKQLVEAIRKINGRPYPAYRDLKGSWDFNDYILNIDHVQSDPFASPSDLSVRIPEPGYPAHLYENRAVRVALQDTLLRIFAQALKKGGKGKKGSGKSGVIRVSQPGQEVIERSASQIDPKTGALTIHFNVGFPAQGRKILGNELIQILCERLPKLIRDNLIYENMSPEQKAMLQDSFELTEDQQEIRRQLKERGLVSFVADGSILPRASGASDRPMEGAVAFLSPEEDRITLDLPYAGKIKGLAIPEGITLIVGGGYHGKSTLLKALEKGVYDHVRGDGREFVITADDAMKIRAEDGRSVHDEDISMFIQNLPNGKSTANFSTEDASGSTSQAANVVEAIESGCQNLLIDEDTSATNFMIRDPLMMSVVHPDAEPIIPFIARIEDLKDQGISTVLVAGSSGSYFDKADLILQMDAYEPHDITKRAKDMAAKVRMEEEEYPAYEAAKPRVPLFNRAVDLDRIKVKTGGTDTLTIAREPIDVRHLEQLSDAEQLAAIGKMLVYAEKNLIDGERDVTEVADELEKIADEKGLSGFGRGNLARPRRQELLGTLNRWRSQNFKQQ